MFSKSDPKRSKIKGNVEIRAFTDKLFEKGGQHVNMHGFT